MIALVNPIVGRKINEVRADFEITPDCSDCYATVTRADFRGLRKLKEASGKRFVAGIVLYDGEACASFGDGMFAVPLRVLWETT